MSASVDTSVAPNAANGTAADGRAALPVRDGLPQPQRRHAMVVMVLGISVAVLSTAPS